MLIGASTHVIGTSHAASGKPCQDHASCWSSIDKDTGIITLCDGAGSCRLSQVGAQALCEWMPQWVESVGGFWEISETELGHSLVTAIQLKLGEISDNLAIDVKQLSSTFLSVVARISGDLIEYRLFHLGDGVGACVAIDGEVKISEPDNGEFTNETTFTTSRSASKQMRVQAAFVQRGSGFALMSDGTAASLFLKSKRALAPAVAEMLVWLNDNDSAIVSEALEANSVQFFSKKTDDDCSIALLLDRNPQSPFSVSLDHPQPEIFPVSIPIKSPRKLIEVALPLDAINEACGREKSIRFGHPSTLHLWWARRPLAAARAVIFAQLVNDPGYQQGGGFKYGKNKKEAAIERKRLFKIIEDLVLWENTTNEEVLERARTEIRRSWREVCELNKDHPQAAVLFDPNKLPAMHDPFAGGGQTHWPRAAGKLFT